MAGLSGVPARPAGLHAEATTVVNSDRPGIAAHNSPAAARDPRNPSVIAVADRVDTPAFSCSVSRSGDGGRTWRPLVLALPPEAPNCFTPDLAFDPDGYLLVLYTSTGGPSYQPVGVWLQRFDGEAAVSLPVRVAGADAFHARLAVDRDRVVVAWVQSRPEAATKPAGFVPPPNPIVATTSTDSGRRFSPPVMVSEPERLVAQPTVVLGADRNVLVGALDLVDDRFDYEASHDGRGGPPPEGRWRVATWRSIDGGATFSSSSAVSDIVIPERIIIDLGPTPAFARDESTGRLYATWDAGRGDDRDVFLAWSTDDGAAWSPAKRVVRRPGGQFLPAVAVAASGRVDVVFYDRSSDPDDVMAEVTVASSFDEGRSFTLATVSPRPFDTRIGFASAQGLPQLGSQLAVVAGPKTAVAFWSDTAKATVDDNAQDLASGVVAVREPKAGPRWWLTVLGGIVLLSGCALAVRRSRPA